MPKPRVKTRWIENPETGCWEWQLRKNHRGYGVENITLSKGIHRHGTRAHRNIWQKLHGPIPKGLQIDHRCQNKGCVNPSHLRLLTGRENVRLGKHCKMNPSRVRALRAARDAGMLFKDLGPLFGIRADYAGEIYKRKSWVDV